MKLLLKVKLFLNKIGLRKLTIKEYVEYLVSKIEPADLLRQSMITLLLKGSEAYDQPINLPERAFKTFERLPLPEIEFVPSEVVPKGEVWVVNSDTGEMIQRIKNIKETK